MLTDEEKARIIERLEFERAVRESIAKKESPKKSFSEWLNSSIGLLVIGALITGVLIPLFQLTQKSIETKRANRFENMTFYLSKLRESLQDFVAITALNAEVIEQYEKLVSSRKIVKSDYNAFADQLITIQGRRFTQSAKLMSSTIYFTQRSDIEKTLEDFFSESSALFRTVQRAGEQLYDFDSLQASNNVDRATLIGKERDDIDKAVGSLNDIYTKLTSKIKKEIGGIENERARFPF